MIAQPSGPASATRPSRLRRALLQAHLWIALILCLPLILVGITGSILVFQPEIENFLDPVPLRAAATGAAHPVTDIIAAAQAEIGKEFVPTVYIAPKESDRPALVRFAAVSRAAPEPRGITVWVDPVSLQILEQRAVVGGALRQVFLLHANLLMRDRSGRTYVGWLGVAMIALGLSGLVLWWPRRKRWHAAFVVKRGARGLRLYRDLHGAIGIWTYLVFIVVSVSGVYLAFPQAVGSAVTAVLPRGNARGAAAPTQTERADGARRIDADSAVAVALHSAPGTHLLSVALPLRPEHPYRISLARAGYDRTAPQIFVAVDQWSGDLLSLRDPSRYTVGETLLAWLRPLHFGQGLGPVWRVLVFLSGFLPALFAITGIAMWLIKRRHRRVAA